jgi:hypothetical protein
MAGAAYDRLPSMGRQVCTWAREPVHVRRHPNSPESDLALELPSTRGGSRERSRKKDDWNARRGVYADSSAPGREMGRIHICTP